MTAEAIAELLEKPLYIVTAGDLGISAAEVETNLGSVLELCQTCTYIFVSSLVLSFMQQQRLTLIVTMCFFHSVNDGRGCSCFD